MDAWLAMYAVQSTDSKLPDHCEPANDFLLRFSSTFHTCVPTNLAFLSTLLGTLSIVSWLFAQLPQIYKNYQLSSTSGLSIFFLAEWLLGDASNLFGSIFTNQATWQIIIACYYCFVDCMLVGQWLWYEHLQHGRPMVYVWPRWRGPSDDSSSVDGSMREVINGVPISEDERSYDSRLESGKDSPTPSRPIDTKALFRLPKFACSFSPSNSASEPSTPTPNRTIHRLQPSNSPLPSPSPRTVLYLTTILAVLSHASAKPLPSSSSIPLYSPNLAHTHHHESPTALAGKLLSWLSTFMYLGSRLPQLYKNFQRRSTAGLSLGLFIAAFFGNLFYSSSILTNPNAWDNFGPYGLGGWVGPEGSDRAEWVKRAAPFWLGAAGVLFMDAGVGVQFWLWGDGKSEREAPVLVVRDPSGRKGRFRWKKVRGWMRGWVPSVSRPATPRMLSRNNSRDRQEGERGPLLADTEGTRGYGGT